MKVEIKKGYKIFQCHSLYNEKVLRLIKRIKKRYYCKKNKTWYLPIEDYDIFIKSLTNIPEIEINSSDISEDGYHSYCKQYHYNIDEILKNLGPLNILEDNNCNIDSRVLFTNPNDIEGLIDGENLNSIRICAICGVKGSGYHYSVYSCEGCKAFFKRTVQNDLIYKCNLFQLCKINKQTRTQCRFCRYTKCINIGMKSIGMKSIKKQQSK